jgi:NADPH-dependent F420 reductase
VIVGSRSSEKASEAANSYMQIAKQAYNESMRGSITGDDNFKLAEYCDVIILSIPYESIIDTCKNISSKIHANAVIVSPIVPMKRNDKGFVYIPQEEGSKPAAELVAENMPDRLKIVSAFHTISEIKLKNIKQSLDADTFICGDDTNCIAKINNLVTEINGLRAIHIGPLSLTYQVEILTPLLLNAAKRNKMKHPGIRLI